jgi:hypothetical protein
VPCNLRKNCRNLDNCPFCNNYNEYIAIDRKIKSPPQIEAKQQKQLERRLLKHTDKHKQGKRNKRVGKRAEKSLESLLNSWGYETKRVPLSGALKAQYAHLAGDLEMKYGESIYRIEVKHRSNLNTLYSATENLSLTISGFCVIMNEENFKHFLNGLAQDSEEVSDTRFKRIHDWFEQDDSDIVAMKSNYKPWIFAIKLDKVGDFIK